MQSCERTKLDAEQLKRVLQYVPETGAFLWTARVSIRVSIGGRAGFVSDRGYWMLKFRGRRYQQHRLAWLYMTGDWPRGDIDHVNGDPLDNRWVNLRDVSKSVNQQNRRMAQTNNTLGIHGVSRRKSGRFVARIKVDGRLISLGTFRTAEEASAAVIGGKRQFHDGATL